MTAKDFLISKNILTSPDLDLAFNLNLTRDRHIGSAKKIVAAMEEYAKQQNSELLESIHIARTLLSNAQDQLNPERLVYGKITAFLKSTDQKEESPIKIDLSRNS